MDTTITPARIPSTRPAPIGMSRDGFINDLPETAISDGGRARCPVAALGWRQEPGDVLGEGRQAARDLAVAAAGLKQFIGDGKRSKNGGLVALDRWHGILHPLEDRKST